MKEKYLIQTVLGCAYAGTGNVLKVQEFLKTCNESLEEADCEHQVASLLGVALIGLGEEIGNEMIIRILNHIMQFCEVHVKRAVPLVYAILHLSNPKLPIMDILNKLAYEEDSELSLRAIFALGLIGAGSNNSRLAGLLRNISIYYDGDDNFVNHTYMIKLAQGILHMGKGMVTVQPSYSDKFLFSKVSLAGIITIIHSAMDMKNILTDKYSFLLYYLSLSMYPRMAFIVDENLKNMPVNVRVGQALDVVGQAGVPKKITGFQTHCSPVVIGFGERFHLRN